MISLCLPLADPFPDTSQTITVICILILGKEKGESVGRDQGRPRRLVILRCPHAVCRGASPFR